MRPPLRCPPLRSWSLALLLLPGCTGAAQGGFATQGAPDLPSPLVVAAGDAPAVFLGPGADAARIAFLSDRVPVLIAGAREGDRVPVRIDGPLRMRGYVATAALHLRVQRRGRVRGAPIYVGPNDLLQVLGPAAEPDRIAVRARAVVGERELGPFDGSYPSVGLAVHDAPADAETPPPGQRYALAPGSRVELREQPNDAPAVAIEGDGRVELELLNQQQGWAAVRTGRGPYLIGWTQLPQAAVPLGPASQAEASAQVAPALAANDAQAAGQRVAGTEGASPSAGAVPSSSATSVDAATPPPASPASGAASASTNRSELVAPPAASTTSAAVNVSDASARPDGATTQPLQSGVRIPRRIAAEPGELRRVAAGTKVAFGEQVIAVFKAPGWARILKSYDAGYADVFAAVDDDVSVRGLVRTSDLAPVELSETRQTAAPH